MPEPNLYFGDVKVLLPENLFYYTKTGKKKQAPPITKTKALSSRNKIKSVDVSVRPDIVKPLVKFPKGRFPKPNANMSVEVLEAIIDADPPQQVVEQVRNIIEDKIDELEEFKDDIDEDIDNIDVELPELDEDDDFFKPVMTDKEIEDYVEKIKKKYPAPAPSKKPVDDDDFDLEELLEDEEKEEEQVLRLSFKVEFNKGSGKYSSWIKDDLLHIALFTIDGKRHNAVPMSEYPFRFLVSSMPVALYVIPAKEKGRGFYVFVIKHLDHNKQIFYEVEDGKEKILTDNEYETVISYTITAVGKETSTKEIDKILKPLTGSNIKDDYEGDDFVFDEKDYDE